MKVKDIIKQLEGFKPNHNLVITWSDKPLGMSEQKWVEVCKIFDTDHKSAGRAEEQIYNWIQSQRDEIPSLGYDETEGEQNNAATG